MWCCLTLSTLCCLTLSTLCCLTLYVVLPHPEYVVLPREVVTHGLTTGHDAEEVLPQQNVFSAQVSDVAVGGNKEVLLALDALSGNTVRRRYLVINSHLQSTTVA